MKALLLVLALLTGTAQAQEEVRASFAKVHRLSGVHAVLVIVNTDALGWTNGRTVYLSSRLDIESRIAREFIVAHELAHIRLGHQAPTTKEQERDADEDAVGLLVRAGLATPEQIAISIGMFRDHGSDHYPMAERLVYIRNYRP